MERIKREITSEAAFARMARYCSLAERSQSDVERLLKGYGISSEVIADIVKRLSDLGFLDNKRYCEAFVRMKISSGWGAYKIASALRTKGIATADINSSIEKYEGDDTLDRLIELLTKKMHTIKYDTSYQLKSKLFRYAAGRGYSFDQANEAIERIVTTTEE